MLGWEWEAGPMRGQLMHRTPSGIFIFAPATEVSA
jgi:hypothetical protein